METTDQLLTDFLVFLQKTGRLYFQYDDDMIEGLVDEYWETFQ